MKGSSDMKIKNAEFSSGISAGLPICLGYISVAFVFGIYAVEAGLTPVESLLVSMFNLTSAYLRKSRLTFGTCSFTGGDKSEICADVCLSFPEIRQQNQSCVQICFCFLQHRRNFRCRNLEKRICKQKLYVRAGASPVSRMEHRNRCHVHRHSPTGSEVRRFCALLRSHFGNTQLYYILHAGRQRYERRNAYNYRFGYRKPYLRSCFPRQGRC